MPTRSTADAIEMHSQDAPGFDAQYRTSLDFQQRYRVWSSLIQRYSRPEGKVIDVGCGSGVFSFLAAEHNAQVLGIDGSAEMINLCKLRQVSERDDRVSFLQNRIEDIAVLGPPRAELVLCSSVLEYVENLHGAFEVLSNLLTTDGTLIVSMPNKLCWYRKLEILTFRYLRRPSYLVCVKHFSSLGEMNQFASRQGLQNVASRYYGDRFPWAASALGLNGSPRVNNLVAAVYRRAK